MMQAEYVADVPDAQRRPVGRLLAAGAAGLVFGAGLQISQMTDSRKVQSFLDVGGAWDPSLLVVLLSAVLTAGLGFRRVLRRRRPVLAPAFHLPVSEAIDGPLLLGSALFGAGWALAGYCPGPAIASLGTGNLEALWFVPAMMAGIALQRLPWRRRRGG